MALQNLLGDLALEATQEEELAVLEQISQDIQAIAAARGIAADLRVTVVGGSTAVTGTLTGVTTVTTVSTVGNMSSVGGFAANQIVPANQNLLVTLANINNVGV